MESEEFLTAATTLEHVQHGIVTPVNILLSKLGMTTPDGRLSISAINVQNTVKLLQLASRMERVFMANLPWNPDISLFGASATFSGGANSRFAGDGDPMRTDYGGVGFNPYQAFCACIGEAAEHDAMLMRRADRRIDADGMMEMFTIDLAPVGKIRAVRVLRKAGAAPSDNPRTSTGYAAGQDLQQAANAALLECVERHALSLWFSGNCGVTELLKPTLNGSIWEQHPRLSQAELKFYLIRHDIGESPVVIALLTPGDGEIVAGYGCAYDEQTASLKAYREACQNEFGLRLELRNSLVASHGKSDRAFPHIARSSLFSEQSSLFACDERREMKSGREEPGKVLSGLNPQTRLVDLTVREQGIAVICALVPGLRDITAERQDKVPWPV